MRRLNFLAIVATVPFMMIGCVIVDRGGGNGGTGGNWDQATLNAYTSAIPTAGRLTADDPAIPGNQTTAVLPATAAPVVQGINLAITALLDALGGVVQDPPDLYDEVDQLFFWGPFPNQDGFGSLAVFIQRNAASAAFDYTYALVRLDESDAAGTSTSVIFGLASPDASNPDGGVGLTMWDFEASYNFELTYGNPTLAGTMERGRFVSIYGDLVEPDSANNVKFVYSVSGAGYAGVDADLLHGLITNGTDQLGFLDWDMTGDFCGTDINNFAVCFNDYTSDPAVTNDFGDEGLVLSLAFANAGRGRGYFVVSGGDIGTVNGIPSEFVGEECWGDTVTTTYFAMEGQAYVGVDPATSCLEPFVTQLLSNEIPSLQDIDAADRTQIRCVADNGAQDPLCQ